MRQKHFIDSHKALTGVFVLVLMFVYDRWESYTLWAYFGMHGCYGLLWILKSRLFGDSQWEQRCGIGYGLYIWAGLSLYWITPWLIATGQGLLHDPFEVPPWWLGSALFCFGLGVFFHFSADMQKHTTLKLKKGLFSDGIWSRSRNPNYLGELLIYASFSSLAQHWIPFVVLSTFMTIVWVPNMTKKDRSLSRHAEFADYKRRSGLLFPKLW